MVQAPRRVTIVMRLGRAVAGFCLGWVWHTVVSLLCLGALAVGYNGLDEGLSQFKGEWWAPICFAAYFASVTGSWFGGMVGPLTLGPTRYRRPVINSSFVGGAAGALFAAGVGARVGWLVGREPTGSMFAARLSLELGVPVGIVAGWVAGRWFTRA